MKYSRIASLLSVVVLLSITGISKADFTYPDFQSTSGLSMGGSGAQSGNMIMLTPSTPNVIGSVWTQDLQSLGGGFSSTFTFKGANMGGGLDAAYHQGVDLIGFVIQKKGNDIRTIGDYDLATNPRFRVKFDGYKDWGSADPSSSSVTVLQNGVILTQVDVERLGIKFREGVHSATINYAQQVLQVLVDGREIVSMHGIDLNGLGLGSSYLGFESLSGVGSWAEHDLLSWSFQSVPEPATLVLLGLGGMVMRRRRA